MSSLTRSCLITCIAICISITHGQNLNSPVFDKPYYEATVPENSKIGTTVETVVVADADAGEAGRVSLSLNSTTNFIIKSTGEIVYQGRLDYEVPALREITLLITATDAGSPPNETSVPFYVTVTDFNDSPPSFSRILYEAIVNNGTVAGEFVIHLEATDKDANSNLTFTLVQASEFFDLDLLSGNMTTSQDIHKASVIDNGDNLNMAVQVSDGLRSSFARIQINIPDSNFHDPTFAKPLYEVTIVEGKTDSPVPIISLTATDRDTGDQSKITYSLSNTSFSDQFTIDQISGNISFFGMIDRESIPEPRTITLNVIATDSGHPIRSSNTTVQIKVNDIDDSGPKFPQKIYYRTLVKDFAKDDRIELFPLAVDEDEGANAAVFYNLSSEGAAVFNMNSTTLGTLTKYSCKIRCPLSNETSFKLTLYAWNAGNHYIGGDSAIINITLVEPPTTTTPYRESTEPGLRGGRTQPGLTLTELIIVVVISCLAFLFILIIVFVLLLRRRKTQRKKDQINFNPSNYSPEKVENEVPFE